MVKTWRSAVSGGRSSILILMIYTFLTLLLTHPLLFHLTTAVPSDIGDPLLNTWILAWDSHALLTDPLNLFNANIFYPLPRTLAYSEHLLSTALLSLPIQLIAAEPIATYNLSLLATFPLAGYGMYLLALRWTRRRSAAFIAGLIFAFAPYRFAAVAHLQLLTFQWLPFAFLCLELTLRRIQDREQPAVPIRPLIWPLALAIFLTLQLLASWYLALYTLFVFGLYLLLALLTRRLTRSTLIKLSLAFLISLLLVIPFAWPYLALLTELRDARPLSLALSLAAAPTDFAAAAPFNRLFGPLTEPLRTRPNFSEENTLFVGFVAPLLVLIALVLRGAYFVGAIPHPTSAHRGPSALRRLPGGRLTLYTLLLILLLSLTLTFPTPYATLAHLFPLSTIIRVPSRWLIPALFALAGLAAFGYALLTSHLSPLSHPSSFIPHPSSPLPFSLKPTIFLLTCTLLLSESFSVPLPLAPVENRTTLNPAYRWLAEQPGPIALVELPFHSAPAPEFPEVKRLYASTLGWWKLVNGYSGYTPPRQPQLAQALATFPNPNSVNALQNLTSPFPSPPLFLLIHPGEAPFDRTHWETTARWQAERHPALFPVAQFEGDYLYQVIPPDPARFTTPIATFGPDQTIQLLAYHLSTPDLTVTVPKHSSHIPHPTARLILYWQATAPLSTDPTVFIHFRAPDGYVRQQADGPPVSGHYPPPAWPPGEIIQDIHPFPDLDLSQVDHVAIGLYRSGTGERLPAFAPTGKRLAEDALMIPLPINLAGNPSPHQP